MNVGDFPQIASREIKPELLNGFNVPDKALRNRVANYQVFQTQISAVFNRPAGWLVVVSINSPALEGIGMEIGEISVGIAGRPGIIPPGSGLALEYGSIRHPPVAGSEYGSFPYTLEHGEEINSFPLKTHINAIAISWIISAQVNQIAGVGSRATGGQFTIAIYVFI